MLVTCANVCKAIFFHGSTALVGRPGPPLEEGSDRHRDTNTHNRQTSMPPAKFEPVFPASQRPQTHVLGRAALGSTKDDIQPIKTCHNKGKDLTETTMKNTDLWNVTPYSLVDIYQVTRRHIPNISDIMTSSIVDFHKNHLMCQRRNSFIS